MIGHLRGTVLKATPERVLLEVAGVGYEVHVSLTTYSELERARGEGGSVALHVFTHVWPDGLALYGFWTELEKALFEKLIAVSGIGPRLARAILSGMPPADLIAALRAADLRRLVSIPGVGKKSAERMVVELRDRVAELAVAAGTAAPALPDAAPGDHELISALVNLGYKDALADRAVREARRENPDGAFHELLRASLARLSRSV
jgi:Holliday junction DNA helicase RuvA